jgi:hypothetical protein
MAVMVPPMNKQLHQGDWTTPSGMKSVALVNALASLKRPLEHFIAAAELVS